VVDAFLDLTLADDLENEFTISSYNTRIDRMAEILNNPAMLLGLGDGGAHLDMLCDSGYPTYVLGTWVRERKVMTLEHAVQRMTSDPADFFGIRDQTTSGGAATLRSSIRPPSGPSDDWSGATIYPVGRSAWSCAPRASSSCW
jgi:N-acyl-D-aspartate/D-glutamate deacylase